MKVLLLSSRDPGRPANPRCAHLRELTRRLAGRHEVHVACVSENDPTPAFGAASSLLHLRPPSWLLLLPRLAWAYLRGRPLQLEVSLDRRSLSAILNLARELRPDLVIHDTIRMLPALAPLRQISPAGQVLDMDDLFSRRYRRMLASPRRGRALGHFAGRMPGLLATLTEAVSSRLLRHESRALEGLEREVPSLFDAVVLVSSAEAAALRDLSGAENIECIPQLIPGLALAQPAKPELDEAGSTAFFVGNYRYAPNVATLAWLVDEVVPAIVRRRADFRLHVYGPHVPADLAGRLEQDPAIELHGWVDDLQEALAPHSLCLSPIAHGSGVKTKLVEAMAWGKAVVSNAVGLEGLPVQVGEHVLSGETPEELAACVGELLAEPERAVALAAAAQALVQRELAPELLLERWLEVLARVGGEAA